MQRSSHFRSRQKPRRLAYRIARLETHLRVYRRVHQCPRGTDPPNFTFRSVSASGKAASEISIRTQKTSMYANSEACICTYCPIHPIACPFAWAATERWTDHRRDHDRNPEECERLAAFGRRERAGKNPLLPGRLQSLLLMFRILQGLGGGGIVPVSQSLLPDLPCAIRPELGALRAET
jgi:hypothetical protein